MRTERYIRVFPDKKLSSYTPEDATKYLQKLGRSGNYTDCKFRQAVDAIRNLFLIITNNRVINIDYQYWLNSVRPPYKHLIDHGLIQ